MTFNQPGPIAGSAGTGRPDQDWLPEAGSSSPVGILFGIVLLVLAVVALLTGTLASMPFGLDLPDGFATALIDAAGHSFVVALGGAAIGIGIAAPACAVAAAMAGSPAARAVLFAALWLRDLQALIVLSLCPVALALFGLGIPGAIAAAALGAALAFLSSLAAAMAGARVARDAAARGSPSTAAPQMGPAVIRGLRQAFAMAFLATVVAEGTFGKEGLGYTVMQAVNMFAMGSAIAAVALTWIVAAIPVGALLVVEWAVSRAHRQGAARS